MKLIGFYFRHAVRDMSRNRQRTLFALFCVAAGVAAIVSLRMLGLMIEDALTSNVAAINHGDLRLLMRDSSNDVEQTDSGDSVFTLEAVERLDAWAAQQGAEVTYARTAISTLLSPVREGEPGRPTNVKPYLVESDVYPFYDEIRMLQPEGLLLKDALVERGSVVISENLALRMDIKPGDQVRLSGSDAYFTVTGVFPVEVESFIDSGPQNILFGSIYLDVADAERLGLSPQPNVAYLKMPAGSDLRAAIAELHGLFSRARIRSTDSLMMQNKAIANVIGDFVLIMGLAALVVGGVGIINTMLVIVGRRMVEIAVLKTIGLKGHQVTLLFLAEAILLGVLGSLLGIFLGLVLSLLAQQVGEQFLQQSLRWRLDWDPILIGLGTGVAVTTVFGFLPTLTAGRVRPAVVLRPNDALVPRAGMFNRLIALLALTAVLGLIGTQIVGSLRTGFFLAGIGMATLGILVVIFWVFIWLVGKMPALGWVDLRLALRAMSTNRTRTATSLLSLTGGVFALSLITLMSTAVVQILNYSVVQQIGGNVLAVPLLPVISSRIESAMEEFPGVELHQFAFYESNLRAVNGTPINRLLAAEGDVPEMVLQDLEMRFSFLIARDIVEELPEQEIPLVMGRRLTPLDADKPVIVLQDSSSVQTLGIRPGDILTLQIWSLGRDTELELEVAGISAAQGQFLDVMSLMGTVVPLEAVRSQLAPTALISVVNVPEAALTEVLIALADIPGVFTLEVASISSAFERLMAQMAAIPLLVAGLALFAGTTIIANTVSLATLERRRQIGIMKALGLSAWRVLGLLLLENAIIGFLGGLAGIGVTAFIIWLMTTVGGMAGVGIQTISLVQVSTIMALSIGIALAATTLTAWGASREKPINVLRYE